MHRFIAMGPCIYISFAASGLQFWVDGSGWSAYVEGKMILNGEGFIEPTVDCVRDAPDDASCQYESGLSAGIV